MIGIKHKRISELLFNFFNALLLASVAIVMLYPFLHVLARSLNDAVDTMKGGITIWPRVWSFSSYMLILQHSQLFNATVMTLLRTSIGLVTGLLSTSMVAFALSKRNLVYYKFFNSLFVMTMFLSGGLIPVFMLYRQLGINNTFLVYILPGLVSAFNMILMRNYFDSLPDSLEESAKIDGASDFRVFRSIILPLSGPILATIGLFIAVGQWNSWTDTLYFTSDERLTTLQYLLVKIVRQSEAMQLGNAAKYRFQLRSKGTVTPDSVKMAITMVTTIPIVCVYPFIQRYFVKGIMLGAVKG